MRLVSALTCKRISPDVTKIESSVFQNAGLTEITIPSGVTEIGFSAFLMCQNLRDVYMQGNIPPALDLSNPFWASGIYNQGNYRSIKVPREAWDAYCNEESWKKLLLYQYMEVYDPPKTPIETAKAAAEEAWGNITLTNHYKSDDLKNDMEEAVKAALEEAGVDTTDVTVEVPFTKFQNIGTTASIVVVSGSI